MTESAPSSVNFEVQQEAPATEVKIESAPLEARTDFQQAEVQTTTEFKVPDEYKEKGWIKNIKSEQDVWKMLDNAQSLIGKKTVVPDLEKASPEEIESYYSQLRPKDKAYDFDGIEDDAKKAVFSEMLYKNGISKKQGSDLVKQYQEYEKSLIEQLTSESGFIEEMKASFGEDYKKKGGETLSAIKQVLTEQDQIALDQMPNNVHGLVYRLVSSITEKYGAKELGLGGTSKGSDGSPAPSSGELKALQDQLQALSRRPHTLEDRQEIVSKIKTIQSKGVI